MIILFKIIAWIAAILFLILSIVVTSPIIKVRRLIKEEYGWPGPIFYKNPKNLNQWKANYLKNGPIVSKETHGIFKLYYSSMSIVWKVFGWFVLLLVVIYLMELFIHRKPELIIPEGSTTGLTVFLLFIFAFCYIYALIIGIGDFIRSLKLIREINKM